MEHVRRAGTPVVTCSAALAARHAASAAAGPVTVAPCDVDDPRGGSHDAVGALAAALWRMAVGASGREAGASGARAGGRARGWAEARWREAGAMRTAAFGGGDRGDARGAWRIRGARGAGRRSAAGGRFDGDASGAAAGARPSARVRSAGRRRRRRQRLMVVARLSDVPLLGAADLLEESSWPLSRATRG